jgi:ribosomal protein S12 methylthiotransferase accessory factor
MQADVYLRKDLNRLIQPGRKTTAVDSIGGIIRRCHEISIDPGEPEIFNYGVEIADTSRYFPVRSPGNNGGAGLTKEAALNAALGEVVERYCASMWEKEQLILGSYSELKSQYSVLKPQDLALFHPSQYETLRFIPFTEDTRISWVWGYSLIRQEPILVPACLIYIPYFPFYHQEGEKYIGPAVSTGLACARSYEEALFKGICEVVERDAFMILWLNRLSCPRMKIESSPYIREIFCKKLKRNHLDYVLINMTTDVPIPAFLCLLIERETQPIRICVGGAAHLDPERAALKALIEVVQTRDWTKFMEKRKPAFSFREDFRDIQSFEDHVALYAFGNMSHAVEFLTTLEETQTFEAVENRSYKEVKANLQICLQLIAEKEHDVIALDLTTSDIRELGFRVVKVLIPGFQQLDADYNHRLLGGKRLYEVPQILGFQDYPTSIEELNPYPHPYP